MAGYKLGERPYENILEKYNVTNPLALVLYDDIYKKGYSDGYAKAIDEFVEWLSYKIKSEIDDCADELDLIKEIAEKMKGGAE